MRNFKTRSLLKPQGQAWSEHRGVVRALWYVGAFIAFPPYYIALVCLIIAGTILATWVW